MSKTEDLKQKYQKKTDIEHIKDAPDTYIGSIEPDEERGWLLNDDKMIHSTYHWVPGLYKCFDEGIVNARDHYVRLNGKKKSKKIIPVKNIEITVDKETGVITMLNDGNGIDHLCFSFLCGWHLFLAQFYACLRWCRSRLAVLMLESM